MPQSALDRLGYLHIEYPMQFQTQNASTMQTSHCGVLEFTADEGFIHIPATMMEHPGLKENDLVLMRSTLLPKATFVKLQPRTTGFFNAPGARLLLGYNLRTYACLTTGETIAVAAAGEKNYYLDVVETRAADAVCIIEADCEVEFEQALDYMHPVAEFTAAMQVEDDVPVRSTGAGMRMDGRPVEEEEKAPPPALVPRPSPAAADERPKRGLRFGASAPAGSVKEAKAGKEDVGGKRFTGKQYSLQD